MFNITFRARCQPLHAEVIPEADQIWSSELMIEVLFSLLLCEFFREIIVDWVEVRYQPDATESYEA